MFLEDLMFVLVFLFAAFSGLILPWINHKSLRHFKKSNKKLIATLQKYGINTETLSSPEDNTKGLQTDNIETIKSSPSITTKIRSKFQLGFERYFEAQMPVWIGGIALALAGLFLVKYSIDNNLLSPHIRITLGGLFGLTLLYSAKWIRHKPSFANGTRIAQSLSGAGIAILYVVSFAAHRLYELVPLSVGFLAMAAVTGVALILSSRHGSPIALLGMTGGFLAPALLNIDQGSAFTLFLYLYFTASGLLIIAQRNRWWWLALPTVCISLLWGAFWLLFRYHPENNLWLSLFLMGISAMVVIHSKPIQGDKTISKWTTATSIIGLWGSLILMGFITREAGFGFMEWGLFGTLAIGSIGLAYFNNTLYSSVPWISMAINAILLFTWQIPDSLLFAQVLMSFAILYVGSGYLFCFKSLNVRKNTTSFIKRFFKSEGQHPTYWAKFMSVTAVIYYLLAYYKLESETFNLGIPFFWGFIASLLSVGAFFVILKIHKHFSFHELRDQLYAIFSFLCAVFVFLTLFIELDREFLSVAVAGEILIAAWIYKKTLLKTLPTIAAILACLFGLLLLPQILLIIQLTLYSLVEAKLYLQSSIPIVKWPVFQLGVPAIMFLGSAYLFHKEKDSRLVRIFEAVFVTLIATMGYYFIRNSLHPDQNVLFIKAGFFERGIITNVFFLYGLICLWGGRHFKRITFSLSGIVICAVAIFRILYFDMLIYNPLWETQKIASFMFFNTLWVPYGLPLVWAYIAKKELIYLPWKKPQYIVGIFMLLEMFVFISLNIRYIFQGEYLNTGVALNAEIYTYSIAWLLLGIGLLLGGIFKKDKMLRYASLIIILLTIGKVFLYDASQLEGLYRVFSFFGLGVSLIGLSYLYTRFVFQKER